MDFLSFGRLSSDHRGLWIDIPSYLLFGYNYPPIQHPNTRILKIEKLLCHGSILWDTLPRTYKSRPRLLNDRIYNKTTYLLSLFWLPNIKEIGLILCKVMDTAESMYIKLDEGSIIWSPWCKHVCQSLKCWLIRQIIQK